MMKILMINSVCGIRSTGRICTDLAVALEENGHEVKIAYGRERVPEKFQKYAVKIGTKFEIALHGMKARLFDADGLGSKHATRKLVTWIEKYNPDIIHLHNLHGYYIHYPILFQYIIGHNKKVVWTLHDCWCFTGHSGTCDQIGCKKWINGCSKCFLKNKYPKSYFDRSAYNYQLKKQLFTAVKNLTIVTPSDWLADCVRKSFLKATNIVVIRNGIDTTQFQAGKNHFRDNWNIQDKTILMGCASAWGKTKGLDDFKTLSKCLDSRFQIVLVGLTKRQIESMPGKIICIEKTNSIEELANIYSSADLFLNLTYADNYPTVNIEALACGTPVLTYATGGSAECLDGNNGISFRTGDMKAVINFLMNDYRKGMFSVRKHIEWDKNKAVEEYIKQY